jgi:hypothetical protein
VPRAAGLTLRFSDGGATVPPGLDGPEVEEEEPDDPAEPEPDDDPPEPDELPLCADAAAERRSAPAMVMTKTRMAFPLLFED